MVFFTSTLQSIHHELLDIFMARPERFAGGIWCLDRPSVCPFVRPAYKQSAIFTSLGGHTETKLGL